MEARSDRTRQALDRERAKSEEATGDPGQESGMTYLLDKIQKGNIWAIIAGVLLYIIGGFLMSLFLWGSVGVIIWGGR